MLSLRCVSGRRHRVVGRLPSVRDPELYRRLADRRFLPLAAREESTWGWVTADNLLRTDFDPETVARGQRAVVALRVDRRRADPRLLRAQLDLELRGRWAAAADGAGRAPRSRDERARLRAELAETLRREASPSIQVCPLVLDPPRRLLLVLTRARTLGDLALRLVRETFAVQTTPLTPWRRAGEVLAGCGDGTPLAALERTDYAPRGAPVAPGIVAEAGR